MLEKSRSLSLSGNDHFWPRFFDPFREFGTAVSNFFSPSVDAVDKDDSYEIRVELPGVSEKDVEVSVENNTLTIKGEKRSEQEEKDKNYYFSERRYGSFQRSFRLPEDVSDDKIHANYKDGVLTLHLPKSEHREKAPRKVEIKPS